MDLIFLCVKSYDLDGVIKDIKEKINEDTILMPLLNGVDIYERIRKNLDKHFVLPDAYMLARIFRTMALSLKKAEMER